MPPKMSGLDHLPSLWLYKSEPWWCSHWKIDGDRCKRWSGVDSSPDRCLCLSNTSKIVFMTLSIVLACKVRTNLGFPWVFRGFSAMKFLNQMWHRKFWKLFKNSLGYVVSDGEQLGYCPRSLSKFEVWVIDEKLVVFGISVGFPWVFRGF